MKKVCFLFLVLANVSFLFAQNLYPVFKKDKWGYMNNKGEIIIGYKYDMAQKFNEGYASVAEGNMPCLIDTKGNRVIDTGLYQFIGNYAAGLVSVMDYKYKRFYLNNKGKVLLKLEDDIYDSRPFSNGLARVGKQVNIVQNKYGFDVSNLGYRFAYIRKNGGYATEFIFDDAEDMEDGIGRYMQGTRFGLIDSTGKIIIPADYEFISNFSEGLAVVNKSGKFGYINVKGEIRIEPIFSYAKEFNDGLAAVEVNGKFGFIDISGTLVVQALYDDIRPFSEGRAAVFIQNKWAFIDPKGNYIYQPTFEAAGYFNEGLCPVKLKGKWGAIDKEGHIKVPFEFQNIGIFDDGIAEVVYKDINLYVNTKGEILPRLN